METLRQRIEAQKDGMFISVGANTGYVYQGFKDGAIPFFDEITSLCVESLKKRINKFKDQNKTTFRFIEQRTELMVELIENPAENANRRTAEQKIKKLTEQIKSSMKLIERRQKMIVKYTEDIINFVPFLDRYVIDEFEKTVDPGVALIVEGAEDAPWFEGDTEVRYMYSGQKPRDKSVGR